MTKKPLLNIRLIISVNYALFKSAGRYCAEI
jgi:hypothetical protein